MLKQCSKCRIVKVTSEFSHNRTTKDGFQSQCKTCYAKYFKNNKDKIAKHHEAHREEKAEYDRIYRETHKEEIRKRDRLYCKEHREEITKYHKDHRKEIAKYNGIYRVCNKDKIAITQRIYWQTDKGKMVSKKKDHKRRALKKNLEANLTITQWVYILKKQNNRCNRCGKKFTAKRPATQDHIISVKHNGNYSSDNIQALCKSCNCSKHAKLDTSYIQTWVHMGHLK